MLCIDDWMGNDMICGKEVEGEPEVVMAGEEEAKEKEESKAMSVQFLASPP
jgi:hypothetical protein